MQNIFTGRIIFKRHTHLQTNTKVHATFKTPNMMICATLVAINFTLKVHKSQHYLRSQSGKILLDTISKSDVKYFTKTKTNTKVQKQ